MLAERPRARARALRGGGRWLLGGLGCTLLALYGCLRALPGPEPEPEPGPGPGPGRARAAGAVTVLLWWEPFGRRGQVGECGPRFNISGCRASAQRARLPEAQAVLFHHRDLVAHGPGQLPAGRPPGQRWVWMNFESPSHSPRLRDLPGVFNWTLSYRSDSDVFVPYGSLRARRPAPRISPPRKTKLVAWVISNWHESQARVKYYHQLKKYVPVDVYGARGMALEEDGVVGTVSWYKFYLAFENSQHTDYITEKLWRNAFKSGTVPIVLGPSRSNYERFIPPDSFIHVDDFPSPRRLAAYLNFLDKNEGRYMRYFAWREKYDVHLTSFWDEQCCRVCEAIRTAGDQLKTIQNLASWFES